MKATALDHNALQTVATKITAIQANCAKHNPEYKPSEWQFVETVIAGLRSLTRGRIRRLVELGYLESKPSDGNGPQIKLSATGRTLVYGAADRGPVAEAPLAKAYREAKEAAPEAICLFKIGDFYEAFNDDAVLLAGVLTLTLLRRGDMPMICFPYHVLHSYTERLVSQGHRVAICEQI